MVGYMVTWTTYGSWLQGEKKGWVKDGDIHRGKTALHNANMKSLKVDPVRLNKIQKQIVHDEIIKTANRLDQKILALAVFSNHVHLVVKQIEKPVGIVVRIYKRDATYALKETGMEGKIWTRGFDKRYCFDDKSLAERIEYVSRHVDS